MSDEQELELDELQEEGQEEEAETELLEESEDETEKEEPDESEETEEDSEDDGFLIELDDEPEDDENTPVIKKIRQSNRNKDKRIKELEKQLAEINQPKVEDELGKKPDLEDFDYDQDAFSDALLEWNAKKQEIESKQAAQKEAEEAINQAFMEKLERFNDQRSKVKNDDYEVVEQHTRDQLGELRTNILIHLSEDPARDFYRIGKNTEKLKQLADIKDDTKFVYELGKLHNSGNTKMAKTPKPEKRVKGTAPRSNRDAKLQAIFEKAQASGDFTEYHRYRKSLKN